MKKLLYLTLTLFMAGISHGQNIVVTAQPDLADWDIIYLTDFDFENGQNNPLIFGYRISVDDDSYPVENVHLTLSMIATIPSLGLNNELLFNAEVTMTLLAPIYITNRDLDRNVESRGVFDEANNQINFDHFTLDMIDQEEADNLINTIMTLGSMPSGNYSFSLVVDAPGYAFMPIGFEPNKQISIVAPANIDLIFPSLGYEFVSDTYPVFEWSSTGCEDYYIRICEYNPIQHSSPEDAMQSEASYPYPDNGSFVSVGSNNQLDYSTVNGRPLEVGKAYAWQVKKVCATTGNDQEFYSEIYGFTISEAGQTISPCQQQLRNVLGDSQYNVLFGTNGPLEGYGECAEFSLDGENMNSTDFGALLVQLMSGAYEIESITTQ
ncbi:MAG: hypothetical protein K9M55_11545 [Candidatus Marinimicrobia bacterium]|nr:hypothetical protein [Candidatus Neomarinimicrobiota bacterium]MCF7923323.1 hypothetical protein [Candidatus Neomarinimicrobiota bacterium]